MVHRYEWIYKQIDRQIWIDRQIDLSANGETDIETEGKNDREERDNEMIEF